MSSDAEAYDAVVRGLLDGPSEPDVDQLVSDTGLVSAMVAVEATTAHCQAQAGLIPADSAARIFEFMTSWSPTAAPMVIGMAESATPVPELVRMFRAGVGAPHSDYLHVGLTSQDVIDTALSFAQAAAIREVLFPRLTDAFLPLLQLAGAHRKTPMVARTLGQAARPITFGLKVCHWLSGLDAAADGLRETRDSLAVQIGGPVGDLSGFGPNPHPIVAEIATLLNLHHPRQSWHTERSRILAAATAYTQAINACAKIAGDVLFMLTPEVDELSLGNDPSQADRGASSAMAHKRNPAAAVLIRSAATRAPGLLASIAASGVQEHERAAGSWQAEWQPLRELVRLCGGAISELEKLASDLIVRPEAMATNLERSGATGDTDASEARVMEYLSRYKED